MMTIHIYYHKDTHTHIHTHISHTLTHTCTGRYGCAAKHDVLG